MSAATEATLLAKLDDVMAQLRQLSTPVPAPVGISVGRLYMRYRSSKPRGLAWRIERQNLKYFVLRYWRRPCSTLTMLDWDRHRELRRRERTRYGRPPSESTMNVDLTRTKQMFWYGVNAGLIEKHPFPKAKFVPAKKRRATAPNEQQIQRLLDHADVLKWARQRIVFRAFATAMADTGMRISEVMQLRWDRITPAWTTTVIGKGDKLRPIAFTDRAVRALKEVPRHGASPYVFVNWDTGKPFMHDTLRNWFHAVVEAAGLNEILVGGDARLVPHHLRHAAATIADARGAQATQVQKMLGHASLRTTEIYLHRDNEETAKQIRAIMNGPRARRRAAQPEVR